ncbi:protein eyes shut homolog isoform X2 [Ciona intestinalis]
MFALDVTSSIYLGGYPNMGIMVGNLPSVGFTGCVREFEVNDLKFDLDYYWGERSPEVNPYDVTIHSASNVVDCDGNYCGFNTCENKGECVEDINGYHCNCLAQWKGPRCRYYRQCSSVGCHDNGVCVAMPWINDHECVCHWGWEGYNCDVIMDTMSGYSNLQFVGSSYLRLTTPQNSTETFLSFSFKTRKTDTMILWLGESQSSEDDHLAVGIKNGRVMVSVQLGYDFDHKEINMTSAFYNDDKWHDVIVTQHGRNVDVIVDKTEKFKLSVKVLFDQLDAHVLHIGGFGHKRTVESSTYQLFSSPFEGCFGNLSFSKNGNFVSWSEAVVAENLFSCSD